MLQVLRVLVVAIGAATVYRVLNGEMTNKLFQVPDLIAGASLVIAAILPKGAAVPSLIAASGYALGVFSVALAFYLAPGKPVDLLLVAGILVRASTVLLLLSRSGGEHH